MNKQPFRIYLRRGFFVIAFMGMRISILPHVYNKKRGYPLRDSPYVNERRL